MNLDSLPPELLRLVIESTVPQYYHSTTYKERQNTLRSLCLVSRRFRQITQPLLSGVVRLESADQAELLSISLSTSSGRDRVVREVGCSSWYPDRWFGNDQLEELVEACPRLERLLLSVVPGGHLIINELACLTTSADLSSLHLSGGHFRLSLPLVSLHDLSITGAATLLLDDIPSPTIFPVLRYLAINAGDDDREEADDGAQIVHSLAALIPQVEAWSIDLYTLRAIHASGKCPDVVQSLPRALIDYDVSSWSYRVLQEAIFDKVQHFRLFPFSAGPSHLANITSAIQSAAALGALRSIYLSSLTEPGILAAEDSEEALEELRQVCGEKGIEVIFEEQPQDDWLDSLVSHDFWRRMKQDRLKEE